MLIWENITIALAGLKSNLMRTLLTMLGIIIGIASVIAIMTVGNSIKSMVNSNMMDLGANDMTVGVTQRDSEDDVRDIRDTDLITVDMLEDYKKEYSDKIKGIALNVSAGNGVVRQGADYANVAIEGVNADAYTSLNNDLLAGREFIDVDFDKGKKVCIVSDKFVENLYEGDNKKALGQTVEVECYGKIYDYHIVGVYKYENQMIISGQTKDITTSLYIPLLTAQNQTHYTSGFNYVTVVTTPGIDGEAFAKTTQDYFNIKFYANNDAYEIMAISMASMLDMVDTLIGGVSLGLSIIAAISLVVGGIGVMNIMLVSITERTKEIGTRKALGATNGSIRLQFITESVIICIIGGIIGIILGIGMGMLGMKILGYDAAISSQSILIAVCFSMAIGIFFGYYPANKAAKLNPIDALRYE
ncbi:MAG: ABC transporter permease [Pseudobutyrivibrio sp.]|nr:ABC transporter permease [Pseudobutyrivibrio sp.]